MLGHNIREDQCITSHWHIKETEKKELSQILICIFSRPTGTHLNIYRDFGSQKEQQWNWLHIDFVAWIDGNVQWCPYKSFSETGPRLEPHQTKYKAVNLSTTSNYSIMTGNPLFSIGNNISPSTHIGNNISPSTHILLLMIYTIMHKYHFC